MITSKQIARREPTGDLSDSTLSPLINQLYVNRGINSEAELDYSLKKLPRPDELIGLSQACELVFEAIQAQANILIVGDYDVDGATSTVVVKQSLELFGCNHVAYFIPDRLTFGYGLSPDVVNVVQQLQPDLVITVDNGISSHDGIDLAHDMGISVIVTDHHLPGDSLPHADAIINPNLPNDKFPGKNLAGVGVAFYFMLGLRTFLRQHNWFKEQNITEPSMVEFLDLVALGTIADVVKFDYVNRLLVKQGMQRINAKKCCQGIRALSQLAGKQIENLSTTDLAYSIAPKINAAGRLDDMSIGVECLLSESFEQAYGFATQLNEINEKRKSAEGKSNEQAIQQVFTNLDENINLQKNKTICLFKQDWHPGIVGLIASRLKDRFNLPSVIFADDNGLLKGSARSVAGVHIRDILASIDVENPGLIEKFGGHAMAAGLSLDANKFDAFKQLFESQVSEKFSDQIKQATITSDGELPTDNFTISTCELIQDSGPWGHEFEVPTFDNTFEVIDFRKIGDTGNHLRFNLKTSGQNQNINAIAFNVDRYLDETDVPMKSIHAVFQPDINRYNNSENLQLIILYFDIKF